MQRLVCRIACLALLLCAAPRGIAALDLASAERHRLENGMIVILLPDRNFPVVSLQMLYRVGARNETSGKTGLAHFLEHMAFRDSREFPDTGLTNAIYAVGGEWHGYTWTDQTTYFATVPRRHLDLLLRIEADRMAELRLAREDMEAERGAVLAEMHMYENDPAAVLLDALIATSFLAHPYRHNTIGLESDVRQLEYSDVTAFYERHYHPANAVLAIVGDFRAAETLARVRELFGGLEARHPTPRPHSTEPRQRGERRIELHADTERQRFLIGYRGPPVSSPDFPAFLVLQELLGGSSGVSFLQNDWGTPVRESTALAGIAGDMITWYPPSEQPYLFTIGGSISLQQDAALVERSIEARIADLRESPPAPDRLEAAIERVLEQLTLDVQTTEDAAHQLAFFDGMQALDVLLGLPAALRQVSPGDVRRVASAWLDPRSRSVAWSRPASGGEPAKRPALEPGEATLRQPGATEPDDEPVPDATLYSLSGGIPVILQRSDFAPLVHARVVLESDDLAGPSLSRDDPAEGHSSLGYLLPADKFPGAVSRMREDLAKVVANGPAPSHDPGARLAEALQEAMGRSPAPGSANPSLIVVSGDIEDKRALALLEEAFGDLAPSPHRHRRRGLAISGGVGIALEREIAQAQFGYIVGVPGPKEADPYRLLAYILSHDYAGRLGKSAISDRGLAYYIDTAYRSDGENGWVTLATGVDPGKVDAFGALFREELARLRSEPPSDAELAEARRHFAGRAVSSALSNEELTASLARDWLWYDGIVTPAELRRRLESVGRDELLQAIPAFVEGVPIEVTGR